jgi:hypothetical protein
MEVQMKKNICKIIMILSVLFFFFGCATAPTVRPNMSVNEFIMHNGEPQNRNFKGGYEILLYVQLLPPGTMAYWFKDNKYVREQYVPNKSPSEYQ